MMIDQHPVPVPAQAELQLRLAESSPLFARLCLVCYGTCAIALRTLPLPSCLLDDVHASDVSCSLSELGWGLAIRCLEKGVGAVLKECGERVGS